MRAGWLLLLAAGCGSSNQAVRTGSTSEAPAKAPPAFRSVEKLRKDYRLGRGCGSGPFEVIVEVPAGRGLSRLRVMSVGDHELPMRFEVSASSFTTYIHNVAPDDRCAARAGEAVVAPVAPVGRGPSRPVAAPLPAAPPSPIVQPAAAQLIAAPAPLPLPDKTFLQGVMYFTDGAPREIPNLEGPGCWSLQRPPTLFKMKLWLTSVQHLDQVALRLVFDALEPIEGPAVLEQRIAARLAADRALADSRAEACRANPHDYQCFVGCARGNLKSGIGMSVSPGPLPKPPLETPPPRPHVSAEWIAGAWRWTGLKYEWDRGFWRLPTAPVVNVAVAAPPPAVRVVIAPPPPPRLEAVAPPPPAVAVQWVPGHWIWNGAAWIWMIGAWQAPPQPAARFVLPRVVIVPGGVTFDPGRWILMPR